MGEEIPLQDDWSINQWIEILDGPFVGLKGRIDSINREKRFVRVKVNLWGRDAIVELNFSQIKPLD